ncbi:MAG: N-acetylneuraminate synthase family protein, partial [Peptococcia bacterium]
TSAYPTPYEDINLLTIPNMRETFGVKVGLSDHSLGSTVALGAVALGAVLVEKHVILDRSIGGPDAAFSMEIAEFKTMIQEIRNLEKALGTVNYDLTPQQRRSREHSRSLFVVKGMKKGETFTEENLKSIRPAFGLPTKYFKDIIGKKARKDIARGTPLDWSLVE